MHKIVASIVPHSIRSQLEGVRVICGTKMRSSVAALISVKKQSCRNYSKKIAQKPFIERTVRSQRVRRSNKSTTLPFLRIPCIQNFRPIRASERNGTPDTWSHPIWSDNSHGMHGCTEWSAHRQHSRPYVPNKLFNFDEKIGRRNKWKLSQTVNWLICTWTCRQFGVTQWR